MRAKYLSNESGRQPKEISEILGRIIEGVAAGVDTRHAGVVEEWAEIAPGDWAEGTPIGVKDGTLLVEVPDGAAASLLRYQQTALLRAIEHRFGPGVVAAVKLRVAR